MSVSTARLRAVSQSDEGQSLQEGELDIDIDSIWPVAESLPEHEELPSAIVRKGRDEAELLAFADVG